MIAKNIFKKINDLCKYLERNNNQGLVGMRRPKIYKLYIKLINFDDYTNENIVEHNSKWPYIPDHPYIILIIGGSGSGKTNAVLI